MATNCLIHNPQQLSEINEWVHDCWFERDAIAFDRNTSTLVIPFERELAESTKKEPLLWIIKRAHFPLVLCCLTVYHVKELDICDTERVGRYDFNEVEYDPKFGKISITTGVPIKINITVHDFAVAVKYSDTICGTKSHLSF